MSTLAALAALPAALLAVWGLLRRPRRPRARRGRPTPTAGTQRRRRSSAASGSTSASASVSGSRVLARPAAGERAAARASTRAPASSSSRASSTTSARCLRSRSSGAARGGRDRRSRPARGVELVHTPWLAIPLGLLWLVGMTNAFNLLDNMDGLAGNLAAISAAFFASCRTLHDRLAARARDVARTRVLSRLPAVQPAPGPDRARLDGRLRLAADRLHARLARPRVELTSPTSTVATLLLPSSCSPCRSSTRHSSRSSGCSTAGRSTRADATTAHTGSSRSGCPRRAPSCCSRWSRSRSAPRALRTTCSTTARIALVGVLVTFVLLVQFASFLADVERRRDRGAGAQLLLHCAGSSRSSSTARSSPPSFLAAYLPRFDGPAPRTSGTLRGLTLPILLFCRYVALHPRRHLPLVWRFAGSRDALRAAFAVVVSEAVALGFVVLTQASSAISRAASS